MLDGFPLIADGDECHVRCQVPESSSARTCDSGMGLLKSIIVVVQMCGGTCGARISCIGSSLYSFASGLHTSRFGSSLYSGAWDVHTPCNVQLGRGRSDIPQCLPWEQETLCAVGKGRPGTVGHLVGELGGDAVPMLDAAPRDFLGEIHLHRDRSDPFLLVYNCCL
jgi:hypothetical protein